LRGDHMNSSTQVGEVNTRLAVPDQYPKLYSSLQAGAKALADRLDEIDVRTPGAEIAAQRIVAQSREAYDLAAAALVREQRPFAAVVDALLDRWRPLKTTFGDIRSRAKDVAQRALAYRAEQTAEARRQAELKLEAARVVEQNATKEEFRPALVALREARAAVDVLPPAGAPLGVISDSGSLRPRRTWDFDVEDITKVPAEFVTVDAAKVRAVLKGQTEPPVIPGLRIFPVVRMVDRRPSKKSFTAAGELE